MPNPNGIAVQFNTDSGLQSGYLATARAPVSGVLVLHAWWGLNDFFKTFCDRLAKEGYTTFAPDLHQGKVANTVEEAKDLMSKADETTTFPNILQGAVDHLKSQPGLKGHPIGVIGFSMGAAWALWLSMKRPSEVKAVTIFYGTYPVDFTKAQASYLGHYSPEDEWEPITEIHSLEEKIRQAGRPVQFHYYPGAKHWFFEDNRPEYDPDKAQLAWTRTLDFLQTNLR